jgi:EmrB/QacA subfamily drug resistance transporter
MNKPASAQSKPIVYDSSVRKTALLAVSLATFCTAYLISSLNVALPSLQREFHLNAIFLGWFVMTGVLTSAMLVVPFGRLGDMFGRKKFFFYGLLLFTVGCLFCTLVKSAITLIIAIFIQSVGAAMVFSSGMAIVTSVYPIEERGKALGITVALVYFGLSSGPVLGGILTDAFGWRSIFYPIIPIGAFVLCLINLKLKTDWIEAKNERFDLIGAFIFSISLVLVLSGFSMLPGITGIIMLVAGIIGGTAFILWEERTTNPILHVDIIKKNRVFAFSNLAALIHYSATSAVTFLMSLYLQYARGMSAKHAGLILVCQPLAQALVTPFAGRLSDKREPRIVASCGMGATGIGLFLLSFITDSTPFPIIYAYLAILGIGFAFFSSPNTNAIMSSVDKKFYGVGSGILATSRMVGQAFSMGFTMLVFSFYLGRVKITPDVYPQFLKSAKLLFLFFALLCCVSIAASLARGNVRSNDG